MEVEEEAKKILALRASRAGKPVGAGLKEGIKGQLRDTATISKQTEDKVKATGVVESGLRMQSVGTTGTYYIYSFDGKLMAEYNGLGECVREYIYLGDRLLAEYQPQSNKLYFYTADHINSVRVVTDEMGNRVFAAAYDPYGGIQKVWENSYTPALKFSGKERDAESNLDYFGARYYANFHYRWLSPDPVTNRDAALMNPQLWNLYSFCRNNPVTYWDPDGAIVRTFSEAGYEAIKATMGDAVLAQNIYWDSRTGLIDINRSVETDNLNYLRLWYLVASPQEIVVAVTDRVSYIDQRNEIKMSIILNMREKKISGITLTPIKGGELHPIVHKKDYILCAVQPTENLSYLAQTLAHELYGHAYLYIRGLPWLHEPGPMGRGLDPNGFVNRYIQRIENMRY